jgi:hypothetical protein
MRSYEFINEGLRVGKIGKRRQQATRGLHKFRDSEFSDRVYELNRVMMAAATTDGTFVPDLDGESWSGRHNVSAPYTQAEQDMLIKAYQAVGSNYKDINKGDMRSQELDSVNAKSPVSSFKGYKR